MIIIDDYYLGEVMPPPSQKWSEKFGKTDIIFKAMTGMKPRGVYTVSWAWTKDYPKLPAHYAYYVMAKNPKRIKKFKPVKVGERVCWRDKIATVLHVDSSLALIKFDDFSHLEGYYSSGMRKVWCKDSHWSGAFASLVRACKSWFKVSMKIDQKFSHAIIYQQKLTSSKTFVNEMVADLEELLTN